MFSERYVRVILYLSASTFQAQIKELLPPQPSHILKTQEDRPHYLSLNSTYRHKLFSRIPKSFQFPPTAAPSFEVNIVLEHSFVTLHTIVKLFQSKILHTNNGVSPLSFICFNNSQAFINSI